MMGRRKVSMEYIQKDKKRSTTYDKRKKGLLKKAYELSTLCDVPLCIVIYPGPNSDPVTYPEKEEDVAAVINRYVSGSTEENAKRRLNLQQGLELGNKKKKKSSDRPPQQPPPPPPSKAKGKGKAEGGYPTWYPALDGLKREELLSLVSVLDCKLRQVEERMRPTCLFYNDSAAALAGGSGCSDHIQSSSIAGVDHGGMMMMQDCKLRQVEERMRPTCLFYNDSAAALAGGSGCSDHIQSSSIAGVDHGGMMMMQWPSAYDPNLYCGFPSF